MNKPVVLTVLCLCLSGFPAAPRVAAQPRTDAVAAIDEVSVEGPPWVLRVRGTAAAPDGSRVTVGIGLDERTGAQAETAVAEGRFEAVLGPLQGRVAAMTYTVTARLDGSDGAGVAAERQVTLGDGKGRQRYRDALERLLFATRDLAVEGMSRAEFARSTAVAYSTAQGKPLGSGLAAALNNAWHEYYSFYWPLGLEGVRLDLLEYGERIFLAPVPGAADELSGTLAALEAWAHAANQVLGAELSGGAADVALLGRREVNVWERLARTARALDAAEPGRPELLLAAPETGAQEAGRYASKVLPFSLPVPEGWQMTTFSAEPTVRLRMRPADASGEVRVRANWWGAMPPLSAAEAGDGPSSGAPAGPGAFRDRVLVRTQESFPAFRLHGPVEADQDGRRVRLEFDSSFSKDGPTWRVLALWVYDPATQVAFGLECMAQRDRYDGLRDPFRALADGFELTPAGDRPSGMGGHR